MATPAFSPLPFQVAAPVAPPSWIAGALSGLTESVVFLFWLLIILVLGLVRIVVWLLYNLYQLAAWPLPRLLVLLRFILSPATRTLVYVTSPLAYVLRATSLLKPLYTFLGSAAIVGATTGVLVVVISNFLIGLLCGPEPERQPLADRSRTFNSSVATPSRSSTNDGPSQDQVWSWLQEFNPNNASPIPVVSPIAARQARQPLHRPGGLVSMTILEESSTD